MKLTKRIVDDTSATDRGVFVWDSVVTGFWLRVRPGGSKTFIAQYRAGGGRSGTTRRFSLARDPLSPFVFPSKDGITFYQGTTRLWPKVVARANLPGVTPHTLRHTIGSAAVSTGETLAMTGALLGHGNSSSTSIYAHMQQDPARRAADRVIGPIAETLRTKPMTDVIHLPHQRKS